MVRFNIPYRYIFGLGALIVGWVMWISVEESAITEAVSLSHSGPIKTVRRDRHPPRHRVAVDGSMRLVSAKICAHFTGTSLFPNILINQDDESVAIGVFAIDGSKADVWCGAIPLEIINGSVLEDVSVISQGHPLTMLVFTYWLSNDVRYDRIKVFRPDSNELSYETRRNGLLWSPLTGYDFNEFYGDEEEESVIDRSEVMWPSQRFGSSELTPTSRVSIHPWCSFDCVMKRRAFHLEVNGYGIFTM